MTLAFTVVVSVLVCWLVASVANSTERGRKWIKDRLGPAYMLVPSWNFFSPIPGQHDYHLFYRDQRVDGSVTSWTQIDELHESGANFEPVLNPIFRNKLLFDLADQLNTKVARDHFGESNVDLDDEEQGLQSVDLDGVQYSIPYLLLLKYVTERDHSPMAEATQFLLMRWSRRTESYEPAFVSQFHGLDR